MASIKVASWNVEDQFPTLKVQDAIAKLGADLVALPEAMPQAQAPTFQLSSHGLLGGYELRMVPYDDIDHREDNHALAVLIRKSLSVKVQMVDIHRNALIVNHHGVQIACVHLDDRHEEMRLRQARRLLDHIGGGRTVVLGDLNSARAPVLHGMLSPMARQWRTFGLPVGTPGENQSRVARAGSLMTRLSDMTSGRALKYFYQNGFEDADPERLRTKLLGKIPAAQLDHILVRGVEATNFDRPRVVASDHLPIVAKISF